MVYGKFSGRLYLASSFGSAQPPKTNDSVVGEKGHTSNNLALKTTSYKTCYFL